MHQGAVDLKAAHMGGHGKGPFVTGYGLQHRRLAHDHGFRLGQMFLHLFNQGRRAGAADFLVKGISQLKRALKVRIVPLNQCPERQGVKAFHVRAATAKIFAVAFHHHIRVRAPVLPLDGHHIGMPRQNHAAVDLRADMCIKPRLFRLFGIDPDVVLNPVRTEILGHPFNEGQIGVMAHSWKGDQTRHDLQRG